MIVCLNATSAMANFTSTAPIPSSPSVKYNDTSYGFYVLFQSYSDRSLLLTLHFLLLTAASSGRVSLIYGSYINIVLLRC